MEVYISDIDLDGNNDRATGLHDYERKLEELTGDVYSFQGLGDIISALCDEIIKLKEK